jgi:hypothetical protein
MKYVSQCAKAFSSKDLQEEPRGTLCDSIKAEKEPSSSLGRVPITRYLVNCQVFTTKASLQPTTLQVDLRKHQPHKRKSWKNVPGLYYY